MQNQKITLAYFNHHSEYFHIYKISSSKVAELPHYHDFFQLCYVSRGEISHIPDIEAVTLVSGDAFVVPPNFVHTIISKNPSTEFFSLSFEECIFGADLSGSGALKFLASMQLGALDRDRIDVYSKISLGEEQRLTIVALLDCLTRECGLKVTHDLSMARGLIESILVIIARAYFSEPCSRDRLAEINQLHDAVVRCKEYIDRHYSTQLSTSELTREFGISRSALCLLFPKVSGKSLKQYITEKRIDRAVSLCQGTNLPFQEISEMVGYVDYSTFFRNFQKIVGISPADFRDAKEPIDSANHID